MNAKLIRRARMVAVVAFGLAGCFMSLGLVGCATNPVSGKREFSLVTPDQELAMGREGYPAVVAEYGLYDNPALSAYVDSVGQSLARVSQLPNLQWHFTVLDDPAVNAFAMPGGYIYITRGILAHLNSEAQLAGVIGHEIGHVTARHSAHQVTQQQLLGLGFGIASSVSKTFQQYSGPAQQALGLLMLKYSRDNETQADELGVAYAARAGWDPREIPATYHMLSRVSEVAGQRLPGYLSTHPDPGDRETRTHTLAAAAALGKTGLIIKARGYVGRLGGLVYGDDPRGGYVENGRFYHPTLNFEIGFPQGWQIANQHAAVMAGQPQKRAMMQLDITNTQGLAPAAYVQQLATAGKIASSKGGTENINGSPAWVGRLGIQNADGSVGSLIAGFVQRAPNQTFEILAQNTSVGDADESAILASIRSLRSLADASRRNPTPDRLQLVNVTSSATLDQTLAKLGAMAVDPREISILNNLELDQDVRSGEVLKVIRPGARR